MTTKQSKGHRPAQNESTTQATAAVRDVVAEVAFLSELTGAGLAARYAELHGHAPRSRNLAWLRKACAVKIQTDAEGGLSEAAIERIRELDDTSTRQRLPRRAKAATTTAATETTTGDTDAPTPTPVAKERDLRLPPAGTVLRPKYKGREFVITVLDEGFEVDGVGTFKSLSAAAKGATGQVMNGFLWCGLIPKAAPQVQAEKGGDA